MTEIEEIARSLLMPPATITQHHLRVRLQQPLLKAATPIITYQHALDGGSGTGHSQPEAHRALFFFLPRETPVHWDPGLDRPGCLLGAHGETGHKVFEEMPD
jgi:hypothetical protein